MRSFFMISIIFVGLSSCSSDKIEIKSDHLTLSIDKSGAVKYYGETNGVTYSRTDVTSFLLRLKRFDSKTFETPQKVSWKKAQDEIAIALNFSKNKAKVKLTNKGKYFTVELIELSNEEAVELVAWGPYNVTLSEKIGKSIGVAYNDEFAIGLMGLNLKSCGGFEELARERFGNTAKRVNGGAVLQGFTRNRSLPQENNNCLQELTQAAPVLGIEGRLIGSKFAVYGTVAGDLRNLISEIEKNEGLPYLTYKGQWLKNTLYATSSKFIMRFNTENIEACLDVAEKAGITHVYHPGIFESWGTYPVRKKDFPNGYQSVRECVEKAKKRNIALGVHTLSNFLTKDDPLITPKPHPNLQLAGVTTLKNDLSAGATVIELADESVRIAYDKDDLSGLDAQKRLNENKNRETFAVRVGDEIIEFSSVSKEGVLVLNGCKRGAYGTLQTSHKAGDKVGRLVSHYYKVFFADIQLQDQVAKNLANFFNETKLEQIGFDGVEGGIAAGHGRYGCNRFIKVFFDNLVNKNIIASSSDVMHYSWHYFANESWGEPWWAKSFRESQLDHRLKVQKELKEDLLPRKMGQFRITANTTLKDIQWVMGLCAGYDTGVDFYISPAGINENLEGKQILKEIKKWEEVRWAQTLSDNEKKLLRDPFTIYGLDVEGKKPQLTFVESWAPEGGKLQGHDSRNTLPKGILKKDAKSAVSLDYEHINMQKEPGQPTLAEWQYYCVGDKQKLQFAVRLPKGAKEPVKGAYLKIGANECKIPFTLQPGEYITSQAKGQLVHFNSKGKQIAVKPAKDLFIENGQNTILFDYAGKGRVAGPKVIVNFKIQKRDR